MPTTWDTIYARLTVFMDDSTLEYGLQQRADGWNAAQRLLAVQHTPRERSSGLTLNVDGRSAALPQDLLAVMGIYDADASRWWSNLVVPQPGGYRASDEQQLLYWVHGQMLYLEKDVATTDDLTLYYYAYWPDIETSTLDGTLTVDTPNIHVPRWAELPCLHMTSAYCLQPGAVQAADIRTWNITVDSGSPIQNSRALQAREHLWWWDTLLGRVPPVDYHHGRH